MKDEWYDVMVVPEGEFNIGGRNYDIPPRVMEKHEEIAKRVGAGELISYNKEYLPDAKSYKITFTHRAKAA